MFEIMIFEDVMFVLPPPIFLLLPGKVYLHNGSCRPQASLNGLLPCFFLEVCAEFGEGRACRSLTGSLPMGRVFSVFTVCPDSINLSA